MSMILIHGAVLTGVAVVAPAALPGARRWRWAAAFLTMSYVLPTGRLAVAATAPFVAACTVAALHRARAMWADRGRTMRASTAVIEAIVGACAMVSAVAIVHSRAGVELGGIGEPIVELTAVHFLFAGVGALTLAQRSRPRAGSRWVPVRSIAIACTTAAPPLVACGFLRQLAPAQVGGAIVMSAGVCLTAALHLHESRRMSWTTGRVLLTVSGMAVWAPMVFAVAWAAALYWDVPAFSVAVMVPAHGLPNALAFIVCGLAAHRSDAEQDHAAIDRALVTA